MAHRILTSLVGIDATFSSTLSLTSLAGVGNRMLIVNSAGTVSTQAIPVGTVTSVGLSMPSAFSVASSPVTGSGTLTVTGAGTTAQYIDGTGALQTFPTTLPSTNVQHQVKAGVAINKGQAVYVTSADGTNMIVGLASNTSEATSSKTMGLLDATVAINGFANVVTEGLLAGLDTSTAGAAGDPVWLGTNGNLIYGLANKPYAPAHLVFIGIVTRKNLNNGEIFVKVQNGFELKEIHDVDLITTTPINGHLLGFDGTLWVNKTIAGWLGYTPLSGTGTTNYVPKWTGSTALGNSLMYDNGTTLLVGTTTASTDYSSALLALSKSNNLTYQEIRGSSQATLVLTQGVTANSTTPAVEIFNGYNFGIKFIGGIGGAFSNYPLYYYAGDGAGTGDYVMMQAGGSERLRIASNGNVQIGTTTNAGYKLDVNGTTRVNGAVYLGTGTAGIVQGGTGIDIVASYSGGAGYYVNFVDNNYVKRWARFKYSGSVMSDYEDSPTTVNGSVFLQLNSTTRGFLKPRMTTTQRDAIATPATGLSIYNTTTNTEDYYNGTAWVSLQTSITNPVTGTGTTNYVPRWTSSSALTTGTLYDDGTNVGIGTTSPVSKFNVIGNIVIGDYSTSASRTLDIRTYNSVFQITTDGTSAGAGTSLIYSWQNGSQGPLKFSNASGEVMRLTSTSVVAIGTTNTSTEGNLFLGAKGTNEGGQLVLQKGTSNTYATHLDNYAEQFRVMYGTDTGSSGVALAVHMSTKQLILPAYTTTSSFTGTVVGYLAFDSSGNILTVASPGGGGVSSVSGGTGVTATPTTGNVVVSIGQSVATSATPSFDQVFTTNNGNGTNVKIGDDVWLGDVNASNTLGIKGQQDATAGYITFGSELSNKLGRTGTGALTWGGYTIYHSNNSNTITALGTITTGVWNGTAITDTYISSASTWNAKQNALTLTTTGTSGAATLVGATLNIPQYQSVLTNPVTGTGTTNYISKFTGTSTIGNSLLFDDGTNVGIGTATFLGKFQVGSGSATQFQVASSGASIYVGPSSGNYNMNITTNTIQSSNSGTTNTYLYIQPNGTGNVAMCSSGTNKVLIGTTTDAGYKLDVNGTARVQGVITGSVNSGSLTLGAASSNSQAITITGYFTGNGAISTANSNARSFNTNLSGQGYGYSASYNGVAQNQTATNTYFSATGNINLTDGAIDLNGFNFSPTIVSETGATIKAFSSGLNSASNHWNLYLSGTAKNYIAGNLLVGTTTDAGYKLDVNGTGRIVGNLTVGATGTDGVINLARSSDGGTTGAIVQTSGITQVLNYQGSGIDFYVAGASTVVRAFVRTTGIGITGTGGGNFTMDASAALQMNTTTQGFLPPRMTATQRGAISTPAVGLVVYQTDGVEGLYVNTSGGWKALTMV